MIQTLERPRVAGAPAKPGPKKLTLWRRMLRRVIKPVIMALLAGGMALGLVAVPVAKAEADVLSAATIAEINGAMRLPLTQVVLGAVKAHPVGFALTTAGALGLLAWETKDTWWPFVTGLFGASQTNGQPGYLEDPATAGQGVPNIKYSVANPKVSADLRTAEWNSSWAGPGSGTTSGSYGIDLRCKMDNGSDWTSRQVVDFSGAAWPWTNALNTRKCQYVQNSVTYLGKVVGFRVGTVGYDGLPTYLPGWSGNKSGPSNTIAWGTLAPPAQDPRSEETNYVASAECIDAAGNKSIVEYTSKGTDGALRMPPCATLKPGTHATGKMWVDGYLPGQTLPTRLYDMDPWTDLEHPLCSPSRAGSGCTLSVWIDGKECISGNVECENWTEINRDTAARVSCHYGSYVVETEQCKILERAYTVGGAPATEKNTDGDPSTSDWTQPNGNPWAPSPQPNPAPGTGTTTGTIPSTGVTPGGSPEAEAKDRDCLAEEWSWDPSSWVLAPIQCGMEWAFVPPKTSIEAAVQTLTPKLEARGIAPFVAPVMAGIEGLGGNGCQGPAINLSAIKIPETLYPFSACEQPMSQIATGVYSFFALSIVLQGGMSCIRGVAAAFGFNWGLGSSKVTDGS